MSSLAPDRCDGSTYIPGQSEQERSMSALTQFSSICVFATRVLSGERQRSLFPMGTDFTQGKVPLLVKKMSWNRCTPLPFELCLYQPLPTCSVFKNEHPYSPKMDAQKQRRNKTLIKSQRTCDNLEHGWKSNPAPEATRPSHSGGTANGNGERNGEHRDSRIVLHRCIVDVKART